MPYASLIVLHEMESHAVSHQMIQRGFVGFPQVFDSTTISAEICQAAELSPVCSMNSSSMYQHLFRLRKVGTLLSAIAGNLALPP